jgi:hypothetical protein
MADDDNDDTPPTQVDPTVLKKIVESGGRPTPGEKLNG